MRKIIFILGSIAVIGMTIWASTSHARGLKGVVQLRGHYAFCDVVNQIKVVNHPRIACDANGPKRDVVVVIGDGPKLKEGAALILKFKGQKRTKVMGKVRCIGSLIEGPAALEKCTPKGDAYVIWIDEGSGRFIIIKTEKPVFEKVHVGDKAILKSKAKRTVVEGC